jgi:hypothetical protein
LSKLQGSAANEISDMANIIPDQLNWSLEQLCQIDSHGELSNLKKMMEEFKISTWTLNDAITEKYFTHTLESEQSLSA